MSKEFPRCVWCDATLPGAFIVSPAQRMFCLDHGIDCADGDHDRKAERPEKPLFAKDKTVEQNVTKVVEPLVRRFPNDPPVKRRPE